MGFVHIEEITSTRIKRNTTKRSEHDNHTKDSELASTSKIISIMFLPRKFYTTPLKRLISIKIWKHYLLLY